MESAAVTTQDSSKSYGLLPLVLLSIIGALQVIDPTINSVAIVKASSALSMSSTEQTLAASIATLFVGAAVLGMGAFGDRVGRRRVMIVGCLAMFVGDVVCALSPSAELFITGRVITGLGTAAAFGLSYSLVRLLYPGDRLATAMARWLALQTAAALIAAVIAGMLSTVSFRLAYLVVPVMALGVALVSLKAIPESRAEDRQKFDLLGVLLAALGLISIMGGVSEAARHGWGTASVIGPICAGLLVLGGFVVVESRRERPAFPIGLFRKPAFLAACLVGVAFNFGNGVIVLQFSNLWQYVFHWSPFEVLMAQVPMIFTMAVAAWFAGRLIQRGLKGRTLFLLGLWTIALGCVAGGFIGLETPIVVLLVILGVVGIGIMLAQTPQATMIMSAASEETSGAVGASRPAVGQLGYAFGIAIVSSLVTVISRGNISELLNRGHGGFATQQQAIETIKCYAQNGCVPHGIAQRHTLTEVGHVYVDAINSGLLLTAGLMIAFSLAIALVLRKA